MAFTIEKYILPDIQEAFDEDPEVAALIKLYMAAEGDEDGSFEEWAPKELDKLADSDVYVLRGNSRQILGFLAVNITEINGARSLFVEAIAVHNRLRGHKIGSRIMSFAEVVAVDNGCTSIQGYALDDNQVVSFYERHGYDALYTRGSYVCMDKKLL